MRTADEIPVNPLPEELLGMHKQYISNRVPDSNGILICYPLEPEAPLVGDSTPGEVYIVLHATFRGTCQAAYLESELEIVLPTSPSLSKKAKQWRSWPKLYMAMHATFEREDAWTVGGGRYWIEKRGWTEKVGPRSGCSLFVACWEPPPEAKASNGKPIQGYRGSVTEWDDAVRMQVNDFWTRWHEGLGH